MLVVEKRNDALYSLPAEELNSRQIKALSSEVALKIMFLLAAKPLYAMEIARELKIEEQIIYYHIHNLQKAGLIKILKKEEKQGATAKFYSVAKPSFIIKFKSFETASKLSSANESPFLYPFIEDAKLNALIVVGSPDPHGPEKARSRDAYYAIDLALFLGTFLNYAPRENVKLDTEIKENDLKNNLILVGGPIVNKITNKFNQYLPIFFNSKKKWSVESKLSKKTYVNDEAGIIVKMRNPFNKSKFVLIIAGKRYLGTKAAILALLKSFDKISKGNAYNKNCSAKVVEGIDLDADGIIENIEFKE